MKEYLYNVTWTLSMLLSVLTGGDRYQPVSARVHNSKGTFGSSLEFVINWYAGDMKHCQRAHTKYKRVRAAARGRKV